MIKNGEAKMYLMYKEFDAEGNSKGENGDAKTIYDLQGRKLTEITELGFYIVDGKRVYVK